METAPLKSFGFTHIGLENWRNFTRTDVDLAQRVFLVGPNASGKSNLLDVFRFLRDLVSVGGGIQEAVRRRGGVTSLRCLAARQYPYIGIEARIGEFGQPPAWTYVLRFTQDQQRRLQITAERVLKGDAVILDRPLEEDRADSARLTQTYLEQVQANERFREIASFLETIRYLHIVPQLVREPKRFGDRRNDPYGGDFLQQVASVGERTQKSRLRRITQALRVAVPQLGELQLYRDSRGTPHLRGNYEHWRPQGTWQEEGDFSDGTLRLLGLLWAVLDKGGPLLLEEPELSLHPEVVRLVPQVLARVQRRTRRQVLMSTHSPDLLRDNGIGLDEVLLLEPDREGTRVRPATEFREIKPLLERGRTLADAVIARTKPEHVEQLALFEG